MTSEASSWVAAWVIVLLIGGAWAYQLITDAMAAAFVIATTWAILMDIAAMVEGIDGS